METKLQPNKRWEVTLEEDPKTGELILPIPQEILNLQGWKDGDELDWKVNTDGTWTLSKANDE
jgi:hypothetical protein